MRPDDLSINCSLSLGDYPADSRTRRARALGYRFAEFWWPFDGDRSPTMSEIDSFVAQASEESLEILLFNFPGGGRSVDDRGLLCVPGREDDFHAAAAVAVSIGRKLGIRHYNPMVGNADDWGPNSPEFVTAVRNLRHVAPLVADAGGSLVIEPLSGFPRAAVRTFAQARELVTAAEDAGASRIGILFDVYHAIVNDDEILRTPFRSGDVALIEHVQIADAPGRGWPGTGAADLQSIVSDLRAAGYSGRFGLECVGDPVAAEQMARQLSDCGPTGGTPESRGSSAPRRISVA